MKKVLLVLALCVFFVTPALADEPIGGEMTLTSVQVNDENPGAQFTEIEFNFITCEQQPYSGLDAIADGDLIGGVLADAFLNATPVDVGLDIELIEDPPGVWGFVLKVKTAELGGDGFDLCP
jgi:hypothetical protein